MRIAVTQFVTLDGVSQGPGSADEDTTDDFSRGGWFVPYLDGSFVRQASEWLDLADGLLLGRRTYEAFARDWPHITDDPFTERMNGLPKYVVTNTLAEASWNPTTVLSGGAADAVRGLKALPGRELQIHGSSLLASSLLAAGLVDTVRLAVAPAVIGQGRRLFSDPQTDVGLRLIAHHATETGLLVLEYETTGVAPRAEYTGSPEE